MGEVREQWDASVALFNAGEIEKMAEGYADDAVLIIPRGTYTGREAILEQVRAESAAFPDRQIRTINCTEAGDTFVAEYEVTGTNTGPWTMPDGTPVPPTGRPVTVRAVSVLTMVDGKLKENRQYYDRLPLMVAMGLLPAP